MLYPPTLTSTQPVFTLDDGLVLKYTLNFTSVNEIKHYQLRIVYQSNNQYVLDTKIYPDGIIYQELDANHPIVAIGSINLAEYEIPWKDNTKYKIQMRFGDNTLWTTQGKKFADWKKDSIEEQSFSEWSTVMLVKAISKPSISILNKGVEKTLTPLFSGVYGDANTSEPRSKYRFALYEGSLTAAELSLYTPIEEMKNFEQADIDNESNVDTHRFHTMLVNNTRYTVAYWVQTLNGYEPTPAVHSFVTSLSYLPGLLVDFSVLNPEEPEKDLAYCRDNGCVRLYLDSRDQQLKGSYVISRTSEKSNFTYYEDIKYLSYYNTSLENALIFTDYTIESGVKYKYALSRTNTKGTVRTEPIITEAISVDFEYSYLYRDNVQLRLMFNQKVSSFKHTVLRAKQDTIGDKYPHLVQNGNAYYAEFPISGLISLHMDKDQTFFTVGRDGLYYGDELVIPADKIADRSGSREYTPEESKVGPQNSGTWEHRSGYNYDDADYAYNNDEIASEENRTGPDKPTGAAGSSSSLDSSSLDWYSTTDLVYNNIFVERKFREKVEEFLNDFTYKLYKSPTEGNIVVGLLNVSLTPKQELGRMIYEFSANAYEILENTLDNLDEYGIISIDEASRISSVPQTVASFGQLVALPGDNIQQLIAAQELTDLGDGYSLVLSSYSWVKINLFPTVDLSHVGDTSDVLTSLQNIIDTGTSATIGEAPLATVELLEDLTYNTLYNQAAALRASLLEEFDIDVKKEYIRTLRLMKILLSQPESMTSIQLDNQVLHISTLRPYQVIMPISTITFPTSVDEGEDNWPIIIDYQCILTQQKNPSAPVIASISQLTVWGQVSGVYNPSDNLFSIIKQAAKIEIEKQNSITLVEQPNGTWKDITGMLVYEFLALDFFEVEADDDTRLIIGYQEGSSDEVTIGTTPVVKDGLTIGKFNFDNAATTAQIPWIKTPSEYYRTSGEIASIALIGASQYIIANYKCYVNEVEYEEAGDDDDD